MTDAPLWLVGHPRGRILAFVNAFEQTLTIDTVNNPHLEPFLTNSEIPTEVNLTVTIQFDQKDDPDKPLHIAEKGIDFTEDAKEGDGSDESIYLDQDVYPDVEKSIKQLIELTKLEELTPLFLDSVCAAHHNPQLMQSKIEESLCQINQATFQTMLNNTAGRATETLAERTSQKLLPLTDKAFSIIEHEQYHTPHAPARQLGKNIHLPYFCATDEQSAQQAHKEDWAKHKDTPWTPVYPMRAELMAQFINNFTPIR